MKPLPYLHGLSGPQVVMLLVAVGLGVWIVYELRRFAVGVDAISSPGAAKQDEEELP